MTYVITRRVVTNRSVNGHCGRGIAISERDNRRPVNGRRVASLWMCDCVALGYLAQNLIAIQLTDDAQVRRCGNVGQDERKADLLQHPVRHRVARHRLADDPFEIESLVKVEGRQAKEARAVAFAAQIGAPQVQVYAAEIAWYDVLQ